MESHMSNPGTESFPLTGTLNQKLSTLHHVIRTKVPDIDRISFALYDRSNDHLKTYADSSLSGTRLARYEFALSDLPSLKPYAESGEWRRMDNIPHQLSLNHQHSRWLIEQGYHSSLAIPVRHNERFFGFLFFNSRKSYLFDDETIKKLELRNTGRNPEHTGSASGDLSKLSPGKWLPIIISVTKR